jgi:NADPH2:quinone reductase
MRAVLVKEFGGPEVLQVGTTDLRPMGEDDVHVRVAYAGVNFLDLHHRSGVYERPLPFVPGREGAGTVLACGPAVTHLSPGDRVAFAMHDDGTYGEEAVLPGRKVARVPDDVDLRTAAAVMLQGLTALSLVAVEARVSPGQTVLVHSAAGGTGSLIVQVARHAGARVLGLASTEEKVAAALRAGASVAGTYPEGGFADWVREQTDGRGVDVIFDAVGGPTFADDLDSLAVRGRLIVYGRSGGPIPPLDPARLADGCLSLTYSRLSYYTGTFADFQERAAGLFDLVSKGAVAPLELTVLPLAEAPVAHAALAARTSLGKHVLDLAEESVPR